MAPSNRRMIFLIWLRAPVSWPLAMVPSWSFVVSRVRSPLGVVSPVMVVWVSRLRAPVRTVMAPSKRRWMMGMMWALNPVGVMLPS